MRMLWMLQVPAEAPIERVRSLLTALGDGAMAVGLALATLALGWAVARILGWLTGFILRRLRFDDGVRSLMGGRPLGSHEPSALASWLVYWVLFAIAAVFACDVGGLEIGASLAARIRDLVPRIVTAGLLLAIGLLVAMVSGAVTRRFFETAGLRGGRLRGQIVAGVLTLLTVLLALEQLGFAAQFVMGIGLVATGAVALGAGLAFGLGCKDLARDFVVEYLRSLEEEGPAR